MRAPLPAAFRLSLVFASTLLLITPATAAASSTTFITNGEYASLDFQSGSMECWVYTARYSTQRETETYLSYACYEMSPFTLVFYGYGTIPNEDLKLTGTELALETNTASGTFYQSTGAPGRVSIVWRKSALYIARQTGTLQVRRPAESFHQNGTWTYSRATASGVLPGIAIEQSITAEVGTNRSVSVTLERK